MALLWRAVVDASIKRGMVDPEAIEDVIFGCAYPEGATGENIARQVALKSWSSSQSAGHDS